MDVNSAIRAVVIALFTFSSVTSAAQARRAAPTKTEPAEPRPEVGAPAPATATVPEAVTSATPLAGTAETGAPGDGPAREGSVEIEVRRLADKLADAFRSRPGGGRYERWAVMPFGELGEDVQQKRLGEVVAALLEQHLKNDHRFICVERMRLVEVVKEMQLAQAGLVEERATEAGQLAGADVLVVGSVGLLGDRYVINARVVGADDAKVLASGQATVPAAGLVALSSEAVVLRTREEAVLRSVLISGWGQMYNRQGDKGGLLMFATYGLLAGGVTAQVLGMVAEREYQALSPETPGACAGAASFSSCVATHRQEADTRYQLARGLLIGAGAVYLYNVLDAWIFGYTPTSSTRSLYGAKVLPTENGFAVVGGF